MQKLDPGLFDWSTWRAGTLLDLDCFTRTDSIIKNKGRLKKHAVGYCRSENLLCRPRPNCYAVMFSVNGNRFWTHLTHKEFEELK